MKRNVMLNWVLTLTFVIVILAGMTVTASAEGEPIIEGQDDLYIGKTRLTNNGDFVAGTNGGTATLGGTADNPVLTLDRFDYSGAGYQFDAPKDEGVALCESAIYYDGIQDLAVILKGENYVSVTQGEADNIYGIYSRSSLKALCFQQSEGCKGSLDVTGSGWRDSYGIEGNIIVNSGSLSVKAETEKDTFDATAISGNVMINNGSLFCVGEDYGIDGAVVTIGSNGSLTAVGSEKAIWSDVTNKIAGKGWRSLPAEGEGEDIPVNTSQNGRYYEYKKVVFGTENDNTHKHGDIIFKPWTDEMATEQNGSGYTAANSLPSRSGIYYLTEDVDLGSSSWDVPGGKTDLCLSGHNIKSDHDDYAVNLEKQGSTLDLYDDHTGDSAGMITSTEGDGVYLDDHTVFNMYGGKISNCDDNGVNLDESGARFNMYGGEISNCYYGVDAGESDTVFTLHSGTITGNKKAGVRVYGTFVIENGLITNNKTGVETFLTSEGIILQGSSIAPVITENTEHDLVLDRSSDRKIIVSDGTTISGNAKIGIYPTNGSSVATGVFTDGLSGKIQGNKTAADIFTSDDQKYHIETVGGEASLLEDTSQDPVGFVDILKDAGGSIQISGWAFDPSDMNKAVEIYVYIGGEKGSEGAEEHKIEADQERTDVDDAYHCGKNHGYGAVIKTDKRGEQPVYVYIMNTGEGKDVCLKNETVTVTDQVSDHEWKFDGFDWNGNEKDGYTSAEAKYVCENDSSLTDTVKKVTVSVNEIKPTCTEGGKTVYTAKVEKADSLDGAEHSEDKEAKITSKLGHSFTNYVGNNDAKCTKDGTKTAKCDRCDEKDTKPDEGSAKGHKWEAATCTEPKTCSVCHATEGEPLGHSWEFAGFEWTGNEKDGYTAAAAKYVCKNNADHKETVSKVTLTDIVTKPTCTEGGKTVYIAAVSETDSLDGEKHTESKDAKATVKLGHSFTNYISNNDAACTEDGTKTAKCDRCDKMDTQQDKGSAKGHKWSAWTKVNEAQHMRVCENDSTHTETEPHKWDDGVVTKKPTTTETGEKLFTCNVCKAARTETIPVLKPDDPKPDDPKPDDKEAEEAKEDKELPVIDINKIDTMGNFKKKRMKIVFPTNKKVDNYRIQYRLAGKKNWISDWSAGTGIYIVKNLKKYSLCEFRIAGYVKLDDGTWIRSKWSKISYRYMSSVPLKTVKPGKKKIKVIYGKDSRSDGYRIQYSLKKTMYGKKTVKVKGKSRIEYTIKDLEKGKTYFFKVRPIKKKSGKTYVGILSGTKKATVK